MLAFDTASETFRLMSRPPERTGDTARVLLELDGELSVAAMQGVTSLAIWALQDYKAEIWTLRYVTVWRCGCRLFTVAAATAWCRPW